MSPWQMVAALGIYTDEQIDEMTWAECVEILNQKAPIIPLYFEDLVVVFNLRLRGARVNSFGILDLSKAYVKPII